MKKCSLILEMCCNHQGDLEIAKKMIYIAKYFCNVEIVKFQKRDIEEWTKKKENIYNSPHPVKENSFGDTYKEHRRFLEFSIEQHKELKRLCDNLNIIYSCSVFDVKSAKDIIEMEPEIIKIPSACNLNFELLEYVCMHHKGEIHLSVGMTSYNEIDRIIQFFIDNNRNNDLIIYACTSGYPVMAKDINLLEIKRLKDKYSKIVKDIGFSGHHNGINIDSVAYSLGATYIERHFTLDKKQKGTDHKVALIPEEAKHLVENLTEIYEAYNLRITDILEVEKNNKEKLKW